MMGGQGGRQPTNIFGQVFGDNNPFTAMFGEQDPFAGGMPGFTFVSSAGSGPRQG